MNLLRLGLPHHLQVQIAVEISKLQFEIINSNVKFANYKLQITIDNIVNLIDASWHKFFFYG